ncbi:MAG TPA: DUF4238 domain-containing protein, partial [Ignavibacteriales bacterium]|nr:DUF4238 domain-containing protein [Ignavibacteriales bacterium]
MAERKNQHFVPQFYLRNFSENKKSLCDYNLSNNKYIKNASIKDMASQNYFYGKDENIEKLLSKY